MERHEIADDKWERVRHLLPGKAGDPGGTAGDNRLFLNAVLYVAKVGCAWRDLPGRFGKWNSAWRRFDRLGRRGVWRAVFEALREPDLEWLFLDSTVDRAHRHAAGAEKKTGGGQAGEALGRSRGGFSTKVHVAVDGLGNPVRVTLTGGQAADVTQAEALLGDLTPGAVVADKAYDSDDLVASIERRGAKAVIPPKSNRVVQREYDVHVYKQRGLVEQFIGRLKEFRRVATRYEKTARNYLGFIHVACIMDLLR